MWKKSLISTALLTLIIVNLFLWPYLFKQFGFGGEQQAEDSPTVTVDETNETAPELTDEELQLDEDITDSEDTTQPDVDSDDTTFKVVDIK
ncbi:hypothetical protein EJF36_18440 [Bacillus sp. HMF5848]|uniref:hypothetical protein n=1 Tax=Bacillus sp. HMF5848 TaxID=2495421 RepID=UPI000F779A6A|nr:hypothetical protein [Bacillus sp. HMF5848]RSK28688.1 hypothetical protein EJF36_18440 [Bacillus sp. HMF5848]